MEGLQLVGVEPVLGDSKDVVLVKELVGIVGVGFKPSLVSKLDPQKIKKGGSGKWDGVEVYTAPGIQAHFRLAFD